MTDVSQSTQSTPSLPPAQGAPATPPASTQAAPPAPPAPAATPPATDASASALADIAKPDATTPDAATPPTDEAAWDLKVPEGVPEGLFDAESIKAYAEFAKELGITPAQAAKHIEMQAKTVAAQQQAQAQAFEAQGQTWAQELQKDPEYGGPKWAATQQEMKRAFLKFGPSDPKQAEAFANDMVAMGIGNYPHLVRWAANVGRAMAEDSSGGGGGSGGQLTRAQLLHQEFPNSTNPDGSLKKGA